MGRVLLVPVRIYEDSMQGARIIADYLDERGVDVVWAPGIGSDDDCDLDGVDLVVSLGGDGTLLRAAHIVGSADAEIPILGLSYGHLGFLTCDTEGQDITTVVGQALAGELRESRRATIAATMLGLDDQGREVVRESTALNEVALSRGGSGKIVEFEVRVNGRRVTELRSDGLVISTATGSTGYALSAGGPIVDPDFRGMVCVPIAPHTIRARAFLTAASDVVEVKITDGRSLDRCVFSDGNDMGKGLVPLALRVRRAQRDVILLSNAPDGVGFYDAVSRVFYGQVR